jgi:hypothetical protein
MRIEERGIRTPEVKIQEIYSLPPLTTWISPIIPIF